MRRLLAAYLPHVRAVRIMLGDGWNLDYDDHSDAHRWVRLETRMTSLTSVDVCKHLATTLEVYPSTEGVGIAYLWAYATLGNRRWVRR